MMLTLQSQYLRRRFADQELLCEEVVAWQEGFEFRDLTMPVPSV